MAWKELFDLYKPQTPKTNLWNLWQINRELSNMIAYFNQYPLDGFSLSASSFDTPPNWLGQLLSRLRFETVN